MSDTASTYARLKAETAAMLGLDPAKTSKTEGLRLDITSLLLLEIDSLQGSILANEQIDLARLSSALTMLQKLLPSEALNAPVPLAGSNHDFSGARAELAHFFNERAAAIEHRELRESERMREENARLREEIAKLKASVPEIPNPGGGDAQPNTDAHRSGRPPAAAGSFSTPIPQPNNVIPIDATARANATLPPAHYLRDGQPREAWRDGPSFNVPSSWPLPR